MSNFALKDKDDIDWMIPARSPEGAAAEDIFYESFNDISFYVEDRDQENVYLRFLQSGLPNVSIEKIFPLDGKKNVFKHLDDPSNAAIAKRIYIVDKDFDDFLGNKRNEYNVVYLEKFCLENYVLDIENIADIACEDSPKLKLKEIKNILSDGGVVDGFYEQIKKLSFVFFLVQKYNLGEINVGGGVLRYTEKPALYKIDETLERDYLERVSSLLRDRGIDIDVFNSMVDPDGIDFSRLDPSLYVCGKCVLEMVLKFCKIKFGITASLESATYRLALKSGLENFAPEIKKIVNISSRLID